MPRIIISYRRSDAAAIAGRIFDRLVAHFGKNAVFMDVDNIPFGIDFREHINKALGEIDILLVVIGPKWIGADRHGRVRINEADDPVRIEVEAALGRDIPVVPVLVDGTTMPGLSELPESLSELSYRNAAEVDTGRDFHPHMDRLIRSMDKILRNAPRRAVAKRLATIQFPKRAVIAYLIAIFLIGSSLGAAWYFRDKLSNLQVSTQSTAIAPATSAPETEQSSFEKAKLVGTIQGWDDFLARVASGEFQSGPLADQAHQYRSNLVRAQRTKKAFDEARKAGTLQAWDDFLANIDAGEYLDGPLGDQGRHQRAKLLAMQAIQAGFNQAKQNGTIQAWDDFLSKVSSGEYQDNELAARARDERTKLLTSQQEQSDFDSAKRTATVQGWDDFLAKVGSVYQSSSLSDQAREERAKLVASQATNAAFDKANQDRTVRSWDDFLAKVDSGEYQDGPLTSQARESRAELIREQRTQEAFESAKRAHAVQAWDAFLANVDSGEYEPGPLSDQARQDRTMLIAQNTQAAFETAKKLGTVQAWDDFLAGVDSGEYQGGPLVEQARQERTKLDQTRIEVDFWNSIKDAKNPSLFETYLQRYPSGAFADIAKADLETFKPAASSTEAANENDPISDLELLKELRGRLYDLNFDPGPLDSSDAGATNQAIREFEQQNALPVTGTASMGLLRRLRSAAPLKPWGTIVYDAKRKKWGMSWDEEKRATAVARAQAPCGTVKPCPIEVSFFGAECAAFAHSESSWAIVARGDIDKAKDAAMAQCFKGGDACQIIASVCADGGGRSNAAP